MLYFTYLVLCGKKFVWQRLEFAFFGALTSVGALFYFGGIKMKRITAIIMAFVMLLSFAGCGDKESNEKRAMKANR